MRRVVFICPRLDVGGVERQWAELLPALAERGLDLHVVAIEGGGRSLAVLREREIPVSEFGLHGIRSLGVLPSLWRRSGSKPDVVVTNSFNADSVGAIWARTAGIPHLVSWHRQPRLPMTARNRSAIRLAARAGAGVIAVTSAQLEELEELGFPPQRVAVVHNGTRAPQLDGRPAEELRIKLGLQADAFIAVLVARLEPEKRIDNFIEAMSSLRVPHVLGVVVGQGSMAAELQSRAKTRGAPIRFVGLQSRPADYMLASDVVCLTSDFEALPMALIEAHACGRASVATRAGGTAEIIDDGVTGLLVSPGEPAKLAEALTTLAVDNSLRHEMEKRARERWSELFSFDPMVDRYLEILRTVTGPPGRFAHN